MRRRNATARLLRAVLCLGLAGGLALAASGVRLRPLPPIYVDAAGAPLRQPQGVGCGASTLVVADTGNSRLVPYSIAGEQITAGKEIRIPELVSPSRVQVAEDGTLFALDGKSHKIFRLSTAGALQGTVPVPAEPAAGAPFVQSFRRAASGDLYLLDVGTGRVVVLAPDGALRRTIPLPARGGSFTDLAVDSAGTVFVLDSAARRLLAARATDTGLAPLADGMKDEVEFPIALAVHDGKIFVVDQSGGGIVILGPDGSFHGHQSGMGWNVGSLRYPSDLCALSGLLFVADRENQRIQIFSLAD
ncbi:MAG TPA: NHL repeat-containing protein [Candidatus Polarisedimenticolia bacterium]|nr:NHL repeat-containing protein [Candidatus Polarisedimenticolia bacterium]